jgi:hypothetical protein
MIELVGIGHKGDRERSIDRSGATVSRSSISAGASATIATGWRLWRSTHAPGSSCPAPSAGAAPASYASGPMAASTRASAKRPSGRPASLALQEVDQCAVEGHAGARCPSDSSATLLSVAKTTADIVYEESVRAITQQEAALDGLRARTGTLLAAASITTAFLGGEALAREPRFVVSAWAAIVAFCLVGSLESRFFGRGLGAFRTTHPS